MSTTVIARKLDDFIENHYKTSKTALLLKGARQVGKTYAIRKFANKHKMNLIEINFYKENSAINIFKGVNSTNEILLRISGFTNKNISLPNTIIFLDEIQKCPEAITWIKFLVDETSCKYALSGSLLGIELKDIESIPVGYLTVKEVFPLDLEEFARCIGMSSEVYEHISNAFKNLTPVDPVINESLLKMVQLYIITGGMPAVVQTYMDTNDLNSVETVQKSILNLYHWDIQQYDPNQKLEIKDIFNLIPSELNAQNKRFILKNLNERARFSKYENGFVWLKNAGVAIPALNITEPVASMKLNENRNLFKLFQNDVGLLTSQYASGLQLKLLSGEIYQNYGAIFENLVAEELFCHGFGGDDHELHYFNTKASGEIDFVIIHNGEVIPIEVKSGKDYIRHNALNNTLSNDKYKIKKAYIFHNGNIEVIGKKIYLPIYMLMFIHRCSIQRKQVYRFSLENLSC